jgi:hypothetical protein
MRRGSFSCFAHPNSFRAVPRTSGTVFEFCSPGIIFDCIECVGARFQVLRYQTLFGAVSKPSGLVFMFFPLGLVFDCTEGIRARFHVYVLPDTFWATPKPLGLIFKFCATGHVFGGTEGVGARFQVLRSRRRFWSYRGRRDSFSSFPLPDSFSTVSRVRGSFSCFVHPDTFWELPRASCPVYMFCNLRLFLGVTEGVRYRFQVLRSRTRFLRYRGRRVPFSSFALPDSFSTVPRVLGLVFMFCAPGLFLGVTEGARSRFHVLCSRTLFRRNRGSGPVFMFCAPGSIFSSIEGVGSRFHIFRSRTRFGRYRGRQIPFSCFALPDTFLVVPRASGLVFMFCAPGLFLGGTVGVESRLHVLRSRTRFGRYRGRQQLFKIFALPDTFLAVPRASGTI